MSPPPPDLAAVDDAPALVGDSRARSKGPRAAVPPVLIRPGRAGGNAERRELRTALETMARITPLFKPRITSFVMLATAAGLYLAADGPLPPWLLFHALLGTALLSSAASTLNQLVERRHDARMERTRGRPLPSGLVRPREALYLGVGMAVGGFLELWLGANLAAAAAGAFSLLSYLFAYTPLKRKTHLATLVGGVPGALPPVIGWLAVRGELGAGALALFAILFLWQLPHFLAIARLYRDDYARGGFPVLTVTDPTGSATARGIIVNCLALLPAGLLPTTLGLTGSLSGAGSLLAGLVFLGFGIDASLHPTEKAARRLLLASLVYLPLLFLLFVLDKA